MDKIIFSILGIISLLPAVFSAYKTSYTCDGDLKLKCPQGEIILVSINTADRYELTACPGPRGGFRGPSPKLKANIWGKCSGMTQCTVQTELKMEEYKYIDVIYYCGTSHNMCSKNTIILANSSYLRSPKDFVFNTREKCECDAELDEPVELSVREVHKTFNVSMPKVTINWLNKTENIKKLLQKNTVKNFKIVFTSNHQAGRGEFLLQYKADRQIRLVCNQEVTHEIDLGTILIAPIAMIALLIIIAILFFIIKGIKRSRKQRLQVAEAHKKSTVTDLEADSRPDLLNYGSTVLDAKSDIPLKQSEEEGVPN